MLFLSFTFHFGNAVVSLRDLARLIPNLGRKRRTRRKTRTFARVAIRRLPAPRTNKG